MIWLNGAFLPESEARISVYDSGAMYGDMVFEMQRSFNKEIFRLEAHLDRLLAGCKAIYTPCPYNFRQLQIGHEDIVRRNSEAFDADDEYRTLINVSKGVLPIYAGVEESKPWVMITVFPLRWVLKGHSQKYKHGVASIVTSQRTIPAQYLDPKVKNRSRLHYRIAELEAKRANPEAFPLLLDDAGYVAESSGSNFFCVKGDTLITPEPRNCLRGVSRGYVLYLARKLGISYRERNLEVYDVLNADEAFFTATPWCITPCTSINGQALGRGRVGEITQALTQAWAESVGCDFVEQARRWDGS